MDRSVARPLGALALALALCAAPAKAGPIAWELYTIPGSTYSSGAPLSGSGSWDWTVPGKDPFQLMEFLAPGGGGVPEISMNVHLQDVASGEAAMLVFGGSVAPLSEGGTLFGVTFDPNRQSVVLGDNSYTLAAFTYDPAMIREGDPPASFPGSVGGWLTVEPVTAEAPEPCTLALAGLGLAGAGVAGWRRRRRDRRNAAHAAP